MLRKIKLNIVVMVMKNTTKSKKIYLGIIIGLVAVLIITLIVSQNVNIKKVNNTQSQDYHQLVVDGKTYEYNTSIVSILLLGIDVENDNERGQADAIEVLLLDREHKQIHLLSIPRDTMTDIRLFDVEGNDLGWQKQHLNLAYAYGSTPESGCMYTSQAVSRLLKNVPMTRYAALNISMLEKVHDIVGTLEVEIPNNSLVAYHSSWIKGQTIRLTSDNVETFLRARDVDQEFSNQDRMERQKAYLIAYFDALKKALEKDFDNTVTKVYDIINKITSNISFSDMEDFANMVLEYEFDADTGYSTIEGENIEGNYHDEYNVDQEALTNLVKKLFYIEEE